MDKPQKHTWLFEISPKSNLLDFKFKEIWQYRDLLMLFVRRDVVTLYKQTVLGPLWYLIQPLLTSVIFTLVFNGIADINTGTVNAFLFNLAGITIWNYFSECLKATSDTFKKNENIFGKVYFPRVIMPLSITVSNLLKFGIQVLIFIAFYIFFAIEGSAGSISPYLALLPLIVFIMGMLGLGLGMIISSMVTKYRDLTFLVQFGIQLLMYVSAVMYPLAIVSQKLPSYVSWIVEYNPLARVIESFRYMVFQEGELDLGFIFLTLGISIIVFLFGLIIFNKTERNFIDTV
ncbi:lipopolysaccharide transport system permease protein [Kordia periserrulae]|uniref:Transport permease protein n=1 Tax=Kordia periserrulae TaxID=701523 RepID=A0A2T6BZK4_9FLAO|nr:ABC transporter permease [Kordia periserrulae]PTX61502.1 lipopolysaccharide transport system permease protein [Kordia periserrulae]